MVLQALILPRVVQTNLYVYITRHMTQRIALKACQNFIAQRHLLYGMETLFKVMRV